MQSHKTTPISASSPKYNDLQLHFRQLSQHSSWELAAIKASQESVVLDQMSFVEEPIIEISDSPEPRLIEASEKSRRPVTASKFEFFLSRVDDKINSLYNICLCLEEWQQEILKGIKKLVAIDELSDRFWKVVKIFLFEFKTVEVHQWLFFFIVFCRSHIGR